MDKEYEQNIFHEVEFYEILLEAYLALKSKPGQDGNSKSDSGRSTASGRRTDSSSPDTESTLPGTPYGTI